MDIAQLERCAEILMAPPNMVTLDQRNQAQQIFFDLQKTKIPFELCTNILKASSSPLLQFQVVSALKIAVIRDWKYLEEEGRKHQLFNFLLELVNTQKFESYVKDKLFLVCAVMLKRMTIDEIKKVPLRDEDKRPPPFLSPVIDSLLSVITSPIEFNDSQFNVSKQMNASSFIFAILNEYSSSTRSSDMGLRWNKHADAKGYFEQYSLRKIFSAILEGLNISSSLYSSQPNPILIQLIAKQMAVLDSILSWNFGAFVILSPRFVKNFDSFEKNFFRPDSKWRDLIVNEKVIHFFYYIYTLVRTTDDEYLIHLSLQCLCSLCNLSGSVLHSISHRINFINYIVDATLKMVSSLNDIKTFEAIPISSMLYKITIYMRNEGILSNLGEGFLTSFIRMKTSLTSKMLISHLNCEQSKNDSDAEVYKSAIDNLFDAWVHIIASLKESTDFNNKNKYFIDNQVFMECVQQTFQCFLQCRICAPEGLRTINQSESCKIVEIRDFEEEDCVCYSEQLNAIGVLARINAKESLDCLTQILRIRISQLEALLQTMITNINPESHKDWININEDLHWVLMITISTLAGFSDNEDMPQKILDLSIECHSNTEKTSSFLRSLTDSDEDIDPVVKILIIILKLCRLEKSVQESKVQHLFSPMVSSSLTKFLLRFISCYMFPIEENYKEISLSLNVCFGRDSPVASELLNNILDYIISNIFYWSSESDITEKAASGLVAFVGSYKKRAKYFLECPSFNNLLEKHQKNEMESLTMETRKLCYCLFSLVGCEKPDFWQEKILTPLKERYNLITGMLNAPQIDDRVRNYLQEFLECCCGIANGVCSTNLHSIWNTFICPIFTTDIVKFMDLFHNYQDVVISLLKFVLVVTDKILSLLNVPDIFKFYEALPPIFQVYAKHHRNKVEITEDDYEDILIIIQILSDLTIQLHLNVMTVDLFFEATNIFNLAKVIYMGFGFVIPFINEKSLELNRLAQQYYKLVSFVCDFYKRPNEAPEELIENIMFSLHHALKSGLSLDIKGDCLNIILTLTETYKETKNELLAKHLEPFLATILEFIMLECCVTSEVTIRDIVVSTLVALLSCFPVTYTNLVEGMIANQKSKGVSEEELRKAFADFMHEIPLEMVWAHISLLKERFATFLVEIHGLINLK